MFNKLKEVTRGFCFWKLGLQEWRYRFLRELRNEKLGLAMTQEELKKLNEAGDLIRQGEKIIQDVLSQRLGMETYYDIYWGKNG